MSIVYLIPAEKVRDKMTLNADVDEKVVSSSVLNTQEIELRQTLGTSLYRHIIELVSLGTITDPSNSEYKLLLDDYIVPYLMYASMYRIVLNLSVQLTDKGAQQRNGEFSQPASVSTMKNLMGQYKNDSEFLAKIMIRFICDNSGDYPEYNSTVEGHDIMGSKKPYWSGIQLG